MHHRHKAFKYLEENNIEAFKLVQNKVGIEYLNI